MMRLYRDALGQYRAGEAQEPPTPFGPGGEKGFLNWLNEPMGETDKPVTRYMLSVREEREDVKNAFPDPLGADAAGFRDWYVLFGRHELDLPDALVPNVAQGRVAFSPAAEPAVNVAGYFRAELGIGVAARSLLSALQAAGIPFNTISFEATANRQTHPFVDHASGTGTADINIVCVNPDQLPAFAEQTGPELRHGRYTIGVWFWEVEDFPPMFHGAFNYVDEIWVASDFMREIFFKVSPKPVFKFRLPVLRPEVDSSLSRADLDLPNRFIFLFSFDFHSVLERKNPLGLIEAFTRAFQPGEGPVLLIKSINGDKRILEMEKLRYAVRGRPDVILRDGYLSATQNNTLVALSDCYVSLHRAEGFGLTIAEAMALGKPAIATAYSGNLEFMTERNSFLCPCQPAEVGPGRDPYPATSHWSEPDIERAAQLLQHVYTHPEEASERGSRGAEEIRTLHSPAVAGTVLRDRLAQIRRRRK
jgi:glycosyltransferase involved in cell wall biosynthesis